MDKERLEDLVVESEALRSAHRDVVNRVLRHFGGADLDKVTEAEVRYLLTYDLKEQAPHLYPQPPQAERRDAERPGKPPRPQPVPLSREQHQDLMQRPPAERLTHYRELQQQAQEQQRS
jgi:hypothetical protein